MSKLTRLTGINTTMKHVPAKPTVNHLAFVTCIRRHCPRHGGEVLKDEIQASNYENCTLKQKVYMLENNNRVQHNATQGCYQPPADTIVHWRNGWPGIGDVLSGTLNSWVRMMDNIALLCKYIQTSELLPEKFSKRVPTYIDVAYIRDLRVCDLAIVYGQECMLCIVFSF